MYLFIVGMLTDKWFVFQFSSHSFHLTASLKISKRSLSFVTLDFCLHNCQFRTFSMSWNVHFGQKLEKNPWFDWLFVLGTFEISLSSGLWPLEDHGASRSRPRGLCWLAALCASCRVRLATARWNLFWSMLYWLGKSNSKSLTSINFLKNSTFVVAINWLNSVIQGVVNWVKLKVGWLIIT